ncbi:MAG: hemolysin family protein [Nanobdellota archaeon]
MLGLEALFLAFLVVLSGFFSGVETAFVSLDRVRLRNMSEKKQKNASIISELKEDPHTLLSTLLIGNNLVNVGASALATSIAINLFGNLGVGIATGVMTLIILIFGEITPKSIAMAKAEAICSFSAKFILFLSKILKPLLVVSDKLTKGIARAFGSEQGDPLITEEEIKSFVNMGEEIGSIEKDEKEMINNIFKMNDIHIKEIMIPKLNMISVNGQVKLESVMRKVISSGHSRIPIYEGEKDNIVGILYTKDILREAAKNNTTKKIIDLSRDCFFVPETKRADLLLQEFQKKKVHIAIVINEYGDVSGLVTLEDVLEEIVGEIYDETDKIEQSIRKLGPKTYEIKGETSLEEIKRVTFRKIYTKNDVATISGYILKKLGKIPQKGEKIKQKKFSLIVKEVKDNRISKVQMLLD